MAPVGGKSTLKEPQFTPPGLKRDLTDINTLSNLLSWVMDVALLAVLKNRTLGRLRQNRVHRSQPASAVGG